MLLHRLVGAVLASAIGFVPLVPPEHVHEFEDDHGHVEFVVHRHAQAHRAQAHRVHHQTRDQGIVEQANHHAREQTVDHSDPPIATLDQDFVVPHVVRLALPVSRAVSTLAEPAVSPRIAFAGFVERLIHGPPRAPTCQRGPPSQPSC